MATCLPVSLRHLRQSAGVARLLADDEVAGDPGAEHHEVGVGECLVVEVVDRLHRDVVASVLDGGSDELCGPAGVAGLAGVDDCDLHRRSLPSGSWPVRLSVGQDQSGELGSSVGRPGRRRSTSGETRTSIITPNSWLRSRRLSAATSPSNSGTSTGIQRLRALLEPGCSAGGPWPWRRRRSGRPRRASAATRPRPPAPRRRRTRAGRPAGWPAGPRWATGGSTSESSSSP